MTLFDRDLLEEGLRQLVARLRASGIRSGIRIIGGAALALRYFDRASTVDIDAHFIGSPETVEKAAIDIARATDGPRIG
jgi:methanogenic corrinoid protein MtbC1